MNKCYQCKQPVATGLKLRCFFLKKAQYCPNCRTELSFSFLWAVFFGVVSFLGTMIIALYFGKNAQASNETLKIILILWPALTLAGMLLTVSFLPLVPYKDWTGIIAIVSITIVFIFGGVLLVMLFYDSFIAH